MPGTRVTLNCNTTDVTVAPGGRLLKSNRSSPRRTPGTPRFPPSVPASNAVSPPALLSGSALLIKVSATGLSVTESARRPPCEAANTTTPELTRHRIFLFIVSPLLISGFHLVDSVTPRNPARPQRPPLKSATATAWRAPPVVAQSHLKVHHEPPCDCHRPPHSGYKAIHTNEKHETSFWFPEKNSPRSGSGGATPLPLLTAVVRARLAGLAARGRPARCGKFRRQGEAYPVHQGVCRSRTR